MLYEVITTINQLEMMTTIEKRILLASRLFLSLMLAAVVISCSKSMASADATGKPEAMSVRVAEILAETISIPIRISGTVRAHQESRLSFKTGGIIKDLFVDAGDRVEKGQLLARLDPEEIDQQVAQARIGMEKAQRDYDRIHNLYVDTVATLMQLQDAHSALDMARTALGIAEYNRNYSSIYVITSYSIHYTKLYDFSFQFCSRPNSSIPWVLVV